MLKLEDITIEKILDDNKALEEILIYIRKTKDFEYLKKILINDFYFEKYRNDELSDYYFLFAKYDMMGYLYNLTKEIFLKKDNGKTLLEVMLDKNLKITINKILNEKLKQDVDIAIILRKYDIKVDCVNIPLLEDKNKNGENNYSITFLENDDERLIKLAKLFLEDNVSDKSLIKILIDSLRVSLIENYTLTLAEINILIEIKEQNYDSFFYTMNDKISGFNNAFGNIVIDKNIFGIIFHETGHAIHSNVTNFDEPIEFNSRINDLENDLGFKKRIKTFLKDYYRATYHLDKECIEEYNNFFKSYYDKEKLSEIKSFIFEEKGREKRRLRFSEFNIDCLDEFYSVSNYLKYERQQFLEEKKRNLKITKYLTFIIFGDILDAITKGNLNLETDGELGHGIIYYNSRKNNFREIIANFFVIYNMKNSQDILNKLKYLIGDDLFNCINNFYINNILKNNAKVVEKNK